MQKRILTLCLAIVCSLTAISQYADIRAAIQKQQFNKETIDQLKATTTVFFYSKEQKSEIESIKKAVTDGWNLTPLVFDEISRFEKYASDPKYSYFIIEGFTKESGSVSATHYYLNLRLFKDVSKKGKISTTGLCRVELYPNTQTLRMGYGKADEVIDNLYTKGGFYNWSPILLKAQLEVVATNLQNNIKPAHYDEIKDDNLTNILSSDTLYIPKTLLMSFNALSGKENEKPETIFNGYRYKYRICTDEELFDIFEISKRGRLLFEYVKSSTDKFITIYDLQQKKAIYRNYVAVSYNLKSKDIESIK
ncbi:hypothetical protein A4H97_03365 [Niastella yeongjuensis]|uniref:Uncharacterized protein n=1 Tax=Niastella yeongjuensis TaxID=354355 RepID=A0A1V9EXM3_9BACT|nr:hypothetical protein [Niastella yeongjuensis]OQP50878.1 hypothetical protein A4H97_03365 [Niastella yeongjuensis]SEN13490.1 hypothetical protein SAMN05660816_00267 [Niastella yeongjuensis]